MNQDIIKLENKYYISVNSTYADDRVRVLNHIDTFGIFDRWGDIKQLGEEVQGIYHDGMRFISDLDFRINGHRPLLLSSSIKEGNEMLSVDLTNPTMMSRNGDLLISKGILYIGRSKFVRNGACYEQISFYNFGADTCEFEASISFSADFKDIFEVRGIKRERRGEIFEVSHLPENRLRISYAGLDNINRYTDVQLSMKPDSWERYNQAIFSIKLEPQQRTMLEYSMLFLIGEKDGERLDFDHARKRLEEELADTTLIMADISTSNHQFNQWITRSQNDLLSLLAKTNYGQYPYAGVPWYNTAFGRDGIITAMQVLWLAPGIAKDVLWFLANNQATEINAEQDAEPGKIIHEMRGGEMVAINEVPFGKYYGSVDATPLFIMLAGAYYERTADLDFIRSIWPNILAALQWIDEYGDIDGDGFIDYSHKSVNGLVNQGWKDSYDSISHKNGDLAKPPIALCEVQGYVYNAKLQASLLADLLGDTALAEKLQGEAKTLKKNFNEQYWDEEMQTFVIALDGEKKKCRVNSSNAGQCLFTGIIDEEKAPLLAKTLMQEDMNSGWGVRTLSSKEVRYNPMSYHNGSVWPHDVALIALGMSQYGLQQECLTLTGGLFNASLFIELQRLPELFCGFNRRDGEGPTDYPVACSPQAWSVAAVFIMIQACLHMEVKTKERKVYFHNPVMPEDISMIRIDHLKLGDGFASLELYRQNGAVGIKTKSCPEGWQILLVTE